MPADGSSKEREKEEPSQKLREQFASLNSRKERLWVRIQQTYSMISTLPADVNNFKVRVARISDVQDQFGEIIDSLAVLGATHPEFKLNLDQLISEFDNMFFKVLGAAEKYCKPANPLSPPRPTLQDAPVQQNPKLPEIHINKFDGSPQKFPAFRALFDSLIHRSNLTNIQKFTYLISYLEGPALKTVETVTFVPDNYKIAYDLLVSRYTNRRLLSQYHLERLFSLKPLRNDSSESLRDLADTLQSTYTSLKSMDIDNLADYLLLEFSLRLLDNKTRKDFEKDQLEHEFPTFSQLISHLRDKYSVSELSGNISNSTRKESVADSFKTPHKPNYDRKKAAVSAGSSLLSQGLPSKTIICALCSQPHKLISCPQFLGMSPKDRFELVKTQKRCFGCIGQHSVNSCLSKGRCVRCGSKRHNSLLHFTNTAKPVGDLPLITSPQTQDAEPESISQSVNVANTASSPKALLGTARVKILSKFGEWVDCRLVLDPGSEINFIVRSLADRLGLPFSKCSYNITGIGQTPLNSNQGMISCTIAPRYDSEPHVSFNAVVVSKITKDLPNVALPSNLKHRFSSLTLADPDFYIPGPIDILLGVQTVIDITPSVPSMIKGHPTAVLTSLGWVLMGSVETDNTSSLICSSLLSHIEPSVDILLRKFWETEEIDTVKLTSPEDEACERHYIETTTRASSGQYIVRMPFKNGKAPNLKSTRERALNRFLKLEKRFNREPAFGKLYSENIKDYISQGHLVVSSQSVPYLLTHHGVLKSSPAGDRVRVVFNPAEKDSQAVSLNDTLMTGPKLQSDLGLTVTRFRTYSVALTCDIKQMFREIIIHPDDRKYFHIFWRFSPDEPITEWEHTRVIFGATSSPYQAQRTVEQLILDEGHRFPRASTALRNSRYIDDCLTGADSIAEALKLRDELIELLKLAGFELGKWASSEKNVIKPFVQSSSQVNLDKNNPISVKVLGLSWNPEADTFQYAISKGPEVDTKRGILSRIARTYDINGYLSPVTFTLKTLLQKLWLLKSDWDEPLETDMKNYWSQIIEQFPSLEQIIIPRFILSQSWLSARLIGFSDASSLGMAAVVYIRLECDNGVKISLVSSKTRVAPLKCWTIPRLELGAACLLSKLMCSVSPAFSDISLDLPVCFSDSTTTLSWIQTPPYRLKTFVSNRVVQIHENSPTAQWRFVPGRENPADLASRGMTPQELITSDLWWQGPKFLYDKIDDWPSDIPNISQELSEIRDVRITSLFVGFDPDYFVNSIERSSTLNKVQRVFAYVKRYFFCLLSRIGSRSRSNHMKKLVLSGNINNTTVLVLSEPLSKNELEEGLLLAVKSTQAKYLKTEISALSNNQLCSKKYRSLSPFLCPLRGLVMVGGRIKWAQVSESTKHPYLIPHHSRLASLLCDHYHLLSGHGGPQLVQSLLHRQFWIPGARSLIRQRIFRCLRCYRFQATPLQPPMGDIPSYRLQPNQCFSHTGIDFAGPFLVKTSLVRSVRYSKCYFAIFVCMVIKAVHLEVVTTLTTAGFLAAFDRFTARRGLPTNIYTDRGSNFRGAAREINELNTFFDNAYPELASYIATRQIKWTMNPSYAPNWGGVWESGVKSVKHHFRRMVGSQKLTFEEFVTLITKIEGILNSRPLCTLSHSPDDGFDYLTPGHFLIGRPILSRPEENLTDQPQNRLSRWQLIQQITQQFWRRWSQEYIHTQIQRPKWHKPLPSLSVGDIVYWYVPGTPPSEWPLGRIKQLLTGKDGVTRVLRIRTPTGEVVRPATKVVLLPRH